MEAIMILTRQIEAVGRTLAQDARLLARVASPEDATIATACARALRDPERVRRLIDGLIPAEMLEDRQDQDNCVPV
jgi:NhaP-type Na+/H+ or K+/H+ antiporter